ncbi:hypothetical protein BN439_0031 [Erwinia amylovora Ea644]|nr:hypothetical protein BN439_0031 [Erwinia amylovora Ea644]
MAEYFSRPSRNDWGVFLFSVVWMFVVPAVPGHLSHCLINAGVF